MKNKFLLGLILFLFGCQSSDKRIDVSKGTDSPDTSNVTVADGNKAAENSNSGEVTQLDEKAFLIKVFDFKKNNEWLLAGKNPIVVDFYADWCGPCKKLSPILEILAKKYAGKIDFYKVNVDDQQGIAGAFGIQSLPTVMYCSLKGKPIASNGYIEAEEVEKYLEQILK